jgi:N-methylhydantoinase A
VASRQPVQLAISGLAGGMIAGRHYALAAGRQDALTLDMGGTSADVGVVLGGAIRSAASYEFEFGLPIAVPVVDLTTVGAGGSSIAGFDRGGLLQVGPASAGADPGPAAYGRGGRDATVTDANLVLGRLHPDAFLGGRMPLDAERARAAVQSVAGRLGTDVDAAAQAIVRMAVETMANAVRLVVADRGLDARRLDLVAFGGAGPLHAALLARSMSLPGVIVPPNPGLASAFGAVTADLRVDRRQTVSLRSDRAPGEALAAGLQRVAADALDELRREGRPVDPVVVASISCRYRGQNFERDVVVPTDAGPAVAEVAVARFHEAHESAYGYRLADATVEFVHVSAVASDRRETPADPPPPTGEPGEPHAVRPVCIDGWADTPVYRREDLVAGQRLAGPAVIEEMDSTTLVPPGWHVEVHASGCLVLHG